MAAFFPQKNKTIAGQKGTKITPTVARASTAGKPSFKQDQSFAKNRTSRRLSKSFFSYSRHRAKVTRARLIAASKASREFRPATDVVVLIIKKKAEDACSAR
jgi:hypothetical protein